MSLAELPAASIRGLTAAPRPTILAGMTPETAGLTFAEIALRGGPTLAAVGVWIFGAIMVFQNWRKERQAAEDRKAAQAAAAESRQVTNGLLAALERQGQALERLINRTDAVVVELQRHQGPGARPRRRA